MTTETTTIDKLFLELSQFTTAKTKREVELEIQIKKMRETIRTIVCTEGEDTGVVLLSNSGPTTYSPKHKCQVYTHENFSPLGDALVKLWKQSEQ